MDYLTAQIKFHNDIIQLYANQIKYLQDLQKQQEIDFATNNILEDENETNPNTDDILLHDQDIIWDRIRKAHPELYGNKYDCCNKEPTEPTEPTEPKLSEKIGNDNNLEVVIPTIKSDMKLNQSTDCETKTPGYDTNPVINRLSQFTNKKRNQIIKNIFATATTNMEKLAELDINIKDNIDTQIRLEADRLLKAYLAK